MEAYFFHLLEKGNLENVKKFLNFLFDKKGDFDINCKNTIGLTALYLYSSYIGNFEIVKFLVTFPHGKVADVNAKIGFSTNLMGASRHGHFEIVKFLVENGANVNITDNYGYTALILASSIGYFEIVKFLVENGADVNAKAGNNTGLKCAKERSNNEGLKRENYAKIVDYLESRIKSSESKINPSLTIISDDKETKTVTISVKEGYKLVNNQLISN